MTEQPEKSEAELANEIGDHTGMGAPDLSEEETPAAPEEGAEPKPAAEATPAEEPASEEPEDEPEEGGTAEEDEGDEEDEAEEEDEAPKSRVRTTTTKKRPERLVPYSLVKSLREDLDKVIESVGKMKTDPEGKTEDEIDEIEKEAEELEKELELPDGSYSSKDLAKILRKAVEIAHKKAGDNLPKELQDRLKLLDEIEKQQRSSQEAAYFDKEFTAVLPELKRQYPNAGEAEIAEARKLLDRLAHTKEFHKYDLDYILFKRSKDFETILKVAAKAKSGEVGKRIGAEESFEDKGGDDETIENIEDLTPEIIKAREAKEASGREASPKDYTVMNPQR